MRSNPRPATIASTGYAASQCLVAPKMGVLGNSHGPTAMPNERNSSRSVSRGSLVTGSPAGLFIAPSAQCFSRDHASRLRSSAPMKNRKMRDGRHRREHHHGHVEDGRRRAEVVPVQKLDVVVLVIQVEVDPPADATLRVVPEVGPERDQHRRPERRHRQQPPRDLPPDRRARPPDVLPPHPQGVRHHDGGEEPRVVLRVEHQPVDDAQREEPPHRALLDRPPVRVDAPDPHRPRWARRSTPGARGRRRAA